MPKYSIIIPTTSDELAFRCVESILNNTTDEDITNTEIILVVNGALIELGFKYITLPGGRNIKKVATKEKIGYTKAVNMGIHAAQGEFIILMNDDCKVLDFKEKSYWLRELEAPLDKGYSITGIRNLRSEETKRDFLVFFLVMMRKKLFDEIGLLDETFNPGGGEDIDFCARAERAGHKITTVPAGDQSGYATEFPLWHEGERTVHQLPGWEEMFQQRMQILKERNDQFKYSTHADVTAYISTKGRYATTLPMAISSILSQTLLPSHVVIVQDDPNEFDMRTSAMYTHLFNMMEQKGIQWSVFFGNNTGQVRNHQLVLSNCKTEWLWRIDDDNVAEPNVLETLCSRIGPNVGAVASAVVDPTNKINGDLFSIKINDINTLPNRQWVSEKTGNTYEVEHLYSTFLYRKAASHHGYCLELSAVGHREETIFTHEMFRAGWKLIVDPSATTWHLREPSGGIRSHEDQSLWNKDEEIFRNKMVAWNDTARYVNLDAGIGDHWIFKPILLKMLNKTDKQIVVIAAHPKVFEDIMNPKLKLISVAEGIARIGEKRMTDLNVYAYCMARNWTKPLTQAFEEIYL